MPHRTSKVQTPHTPKAQIGGRASRVDKDGVAPGSLSKAAAKMTPKKLLAPVEVKTPTKPKTQTSKATDDPKTPAKIKAADTDNMKTPVKGDAAPAPPVTP